ncbi:universal stress protein [Haloarcula nitratireducens]|uniref:Universal stress protein n=1 Tax=Haloarcula nitratireducens TaxID=2487749 RepID=A0AAW4P7B4_9EURY|nr:universal stress protein [Halomicroarcula nitratireducens]MBX0293648.1 universal stress protein [Halomicroarcula nitratireducens]
MADRILVPFDGSPCANRGVERALELYPEATVTVFRVVEPVSEEGIARSDAPLETNADTTDGLLTRPQPDVTSERVEAVVEPGVPVPEIVEYAEEHDMDAIVVGTDDRSKLSRLLFGSVSESVAENASVPVRIVS